MEKLEMAQNMEWQSKMSDWQDKTSIQSLLTEQKHIPLCKIQETTSWSQETLNKNMQEGLEQIC
jgi:hypothetical protein